MQTCVILQNRLALTSETAATAGLSDGGGARLTADGGRLLVDAASDGAPVRHLQLPISRVLMESLGWRSGDVVGIETEGGRLSVAPVDDPMDPALTSIGYDGLPVPPHWLVQTVIGHPHRNHFVARGHEVARFFAELIEQHRPAPDPAVMDFGCGCGRVARVLPSYLSCELSGCDINAAAIGWCRQNLPGDYLVSSETPPLPLDGAQFDVLYAISLLTHLDSSHQDAWLAEWQRVVRPGGLLLVTYRGEGFLASRGPAAREPIEQMWKERGFGFTDTDFWQGVFPDYYGGAYHRHEYVREHWGRYFEIVEQRPATETLLVQDLAVMRRS